MPEVQARVDEGDSRQWDIKPPDVGIVRFCPRCGRNDRVGTLGDRHWAGGALCDGVIVTLEYKLAQPADAEHQRLQAAVVEACSAYCASVLDMEENGWPTTMSKDEWHYGHLQKQTAMIDAYKALQVFQSEHKIGDQK
jgi:hypothetical protein